MVNVEELLGDTADRLAAKRADNADRPKRRPRGPVIPPNPPKDPSTGASFYPDNVYVMGPDAVAIGDSNASLDLSSFPDRLQRVLTEFAGTERNVNIEYNEPPETAALVPYVEGDSKVKESVNALASITETKLDALTDTVDMQSRRQIDTIDKGNNLIGNLRDIYADQFSYQKDRDFDQDQKELSKDKEPELGEQSEDIKAPTMPFGGMMGGLGGMFGLGGLGGFGGFGGTSGGGKLGRIMGVLGKGMQIISAVVTGLILAYDVLQAFFGVDLIKMVKDGFTYLKDNWNNLADKAFEKLNAAFNDLPGMLGDVVRSVGTAIREAFTNILDMIPGFRTLRETVGDAVGQDSIDAASAVYDTGSGTVATALGVAGAGYATKKFIQGRQSTPTFVEESTTQRPVNAQPNQGARGGLFSNLRNSAKNLITEGAKGKGKYALLATGGLLALDMFRSDDDEIDASEVSIPEPQLEQLNASYEQPDSSMGSALALAGAGGLGYMGVNKLRSVREARANPMPPVSAPDVPERAVRVPKAGLLRTLGRVPILEPLFAGADVYSTYNDATLSDDEKTVEYAGAGGRLGGALAGGSAGAALGTMILPFAGTAVGGFLGAMAGGWLGEEAVEGIVSSIMGEDEPESKAYTESDMTFQDREFAELEESINNSARQAGLMDASGNIIDGSARLRNGEIISQTFDSNPIVESARESANELRRSSNYVESHLANRSRQNKKERALLEKEREEAKERTYVANYALIEAEIESIKSTSPGLSYARAQEIVRTKHGLSPEPSSREYNLSTNQPVFDYRNLDSQAEIVDAVSQSYSSFINSPIEQNISPMIDSTMPSNVPERFSPFEKQDPPEVIVNIPEPKPEKKNSVVSQKAAKPKDMPKQASVFNNRPSLNNVPVIVDDPTFTLINLGYI
tara:strand:+ start:77291 stop:80029 length:2739 start_codon:yes stop_codon:yes gene_type:complete